MPVFKAQALTVDRHKSLVLTYHDVTCHIIYKDRPCQNLCAEENLKKKKTQLTCDIQLQVYFIFFSILLLFFRAQSFKSDGDQEKYTLSVGIDLMDKAKPLQVNHDPPLPDQDADHVNQAIRVSLHSKQVEIEFEEEKTPPLSQSTQKNLPIYFVNMSFKENKNK